LLIVILIEVINLLEIKVEFFSDRVQHWKQFINPLKILMAITLFNIFRNKKFRSKVINVAASISFMVYVIHENGLIRGYFRSIV
jgi:putative effector of murein hydrolase